MDRRETLYEAYGKDLLALIDGEGCPGLGADCLAVVRDGTDVVPVEGCRVMHYSEPFEELLPWSMPGKSHKPQNLMSVEENEALLDRILYGALAFSVDGLPYNIGINHILLDHRVYFHCGKRGFKLAGLGKRACFTVVEDLGGAGCGTHNFRSLQIFGTLKVIEDYDIKKAAFLRLIQHSNPNHAPYEDRMQESTILFEIENQYMIGREHILP